MQWSEFLARVRERGQYTTLQEAERVTHVVLAALGGQLTGPERTELAACLPRTARHVLTSQLRAAQPLPAAEFVDSLTPRIEGATPATARWDASSVLGSVADLLDPDLLDRVIGKLPPGWALLFGRAQLLAHAA